MPVKLEAGLAKSRPVGEPLTSASESLLFNLLPGKLSKNWPRVSAGVNCDKLRRRFFFKGARLSNNSLLTVIKIGNYFIEILNFRALFIAN